MERNADYKWRDSILKKWQVSESQEPHGCGNLENCLVWVNGDSQWINPAGRLSSWSQTKSMYDLIRSPDLLYRIACTFDATIKTLGQSGYKCVWHVNLLHIESGENIGFGEHKGAAGFWSRFHGIEPTEHSPAVPSKALLTDIKEIVDYFTSDVCAHPYDGLVAGFIA